MEDYRKSGNSLEKVLDRYVGQPVEILTDDGVRYCGIELTASGDGVEIIDKCSRVIFIPLRHIDAVVEPKMKLTPFCGKYDCDCSQDDCEYDSSYCYGRGNNRGSDNNSGRGNDRDYDND